jgi:hypothetical protein
MPARHGFVQVPVGRQIEERHLRAEDTTYRVGKIEQAAYVDVREASWLARLGARLARRPARTTARLLRPFDEDGRDALSLLASPPPELGPEEDRGEEPRRVAGRVSRLGGTSPVVVEDAWFGRDERTWRVTEGVDFVIERGRGDAVVVSFGLAPLVVARAEPTPLLPHLDTLTPETRRLVPSDLVAPGAGARIRISVGDEVEVWGVCRGLSDSRRVFDFAGRSMDYRTAPKPARVVGDEDGTRLVIVRAS